MVARWSWAGAVVAAVLVLGCSSRSADRDELRDGALEQLDSSELTTDGRRGVAVLERVPGQDQGQGDRGAGSGQVNRPPRPGERMVLPPPRDGSDGSAAGSGLAELRDRLEATTGQFDVGPQIGDAVIDAGVGAVPQVSTRSLLDGDVGSSSLLSGAVASIVTDSAPDISRVTPWAVNTRPWGVRTDTVVREVITGIDTGGDGTGVFTGPEPLATSIGDAESWTTVQLRLLELGYDPGPVDGLDGPATRDALRAVARVNGAGEPIDPAQAVRLLADARPPEPLLDSGADRIEIDTSRGVLVLWRRGSPALIVTADPPATPTSGPIRIVGRGGDPGAVGVADHVVVPLNDLVAAGTVVHLL